MCCFSGLRSTDKTSRENSNQASENTKTDSTTETESQKSATSDNSETERRDRDDYINIDGQEPSGFQRAVWGLICSKSFGWIGYHPIHYIHNAVGSYVGQQ